jgi:hypothetical protein
MIDETILRESYEGRISLLKNLGHRDVADVEHKLRLLVNECLANIITGHHNLPPREYNDTESNQYLTIKIPSQRLKDIERELDELIKWFEGGRKPRSREWISSYSIAAMVGHPPFGKTIIAATKRKSTRIAGAGRGSNCYRLDRRQIYFWDMLSTNNAIMRGQIDLYSNLRDEEGNRLYLEFIPLETNWPDSFKRLVQRYRRLDRILVKDLKSALSPRDFQHMVAGTTQARSLVQFMRADCGKTTIEQWTGCEPGFALITAMLNAIWPYSKGQPAVSSLGERRAEGDHSEREFLSDLAQNLVDLTQVKLDANPEFESESYNSVRALKHFLGNPAHYMTKVNDILLLILSLREELVAYFVARHTINEICEAVFSNENDEEIIAAADRIIGPVVDKIDSRLAARRAFLNFGTDHPRGNVFKWFGRLDPDARQCWRGEKELAGMIFPVADLDQDRHLTLYGDLIRSFEPDADTQRAWSKLSAWAGDPEAGRKFWRVVIPEIDDRDDFSTEGLFLG